MPRSSPSNTAGARVRIFLALIWFVLLMAFIAGCTLITPARTATVVIATPSASATESPTAALVDTIPPPSLPTPTTVFATARLDPITPIPDPITSLKIPPETRLLVLLGSDNPSPFISRTNAVMLAFYNPRLAKVALLSLPPEMFVYIPGFTMQRLNTAYAVGGFPMLADTIEYNIGIRPNEYAVVHVYDFAWFVEELNGLDVDVFRDYYDVCGGIPAGSVHLQGGDVLCYVSFRDGWDIRDQAERQQQVVWKLFSRLVQGGKLIDLDDIYLTYKAAVESNLSLPTMLANIPLALRLGQPDRFGFFQPTFDMFIPWDIPGDVKTTVLLPRGGRLISMVQDALDFTTVAVQSSDMILTLEYELTISPTPTNTQTASPTFTLTPSITPSPSITPTLTITPGGPTLTASATLTPSPTTAGYP